MTEWKNVDEVMTKHLVLEEVTQVRQWCISASTLEDVGRNLRQITLIFDHGVQIALAHSERAKLSPRTVPLRVEAAALQAQGELESEELMLQQRKREFKIKVELEKNNAEDQVYQEFDTNHAVSVSADENIFKYICVNLQM